VKGTVVSLRRDNAFPVSERLEAMAGIRGTSRQRTSPAHLIGFSSPGTGQTADKQPLGFAGFAGQTKNAASYWPAAFPLFCDRWNGCQLMQRKFAAELFAGT
jgi:hypothetical protein